MTNLVSWLFALAHVFAPGMYGSFPGWEESTAERRDRDESIALDIAAVSQSRDDAALLLALGVPGPIQGPTSRRADSAMGRTRVYQSMRAPCA